jgi:hypothetical protein
MRFSPTLVALVSMAVLSVAKGAQATPSFPEVIETHVGLDFRPPCSVCHATTSGGGPMARPFGIALRERGMRASDSASLRVALDKLEEDGVDSDGDGMPDLAQLRAGLDPNTGVSLGGPELGYGCFASIHRPGKPRGGGLVFVALALAVALLRIRQAPRGDC